MTGGRDALDQPVHMLQQFPGKHGTNVGGQAAWGAAEIKLRDIMVQAGQTMGAMTPDTAERAFGEAVADRRLCVINCSKLMPFQADKVNDVVAGADKQVLFVASGGNKGFSFPIAPTRLADIQFASTPRPDPPRGDFPRHFLNTIWVGGCKRDRTPHPDRGCGPAIDVLVPSDSMTLYTPLSLMESATAGTMEKFKAALLSGLAADKLTLPPNTMNMYKRSRLDILANKDVDDLNEKEAIELEELRLESQQANPLIARYDAVRQQIDLLPTADPAAWLTSVQQIAANLPRTEATLQNSISARVKNSALGPVPARERLLAARLAANDVASDEGVSFGLPIVSNVAAKLKLICKTLVPDQLRRMLVDTADLDPGFENLSMSRGMLNPLRAYFAAYDREVCTGGRDPRDYTVGIDDRVDARRRLYYTLFHMGEDGRQLFDRVRARLHRTYADLGIDLVEAEPPIPLPEEPHSYVEGPSIRGHNWTQVVPIRRHPLIYREKHLRLILVNQCAVPQGNKLGGVLLKRTCVCHQPPTPPHQPTPPLAWRINNPVNSPVLVEPGAWQADTFTCTLRTPGGTRMVFPLDPLHIVAKASVSGMPLADAVIRVTRDSDAQATVQITLPFQPGADAEVELELGVLQLIGGSRSGRDIFLNKGYHGGAAGTPDADASTLVLMLHEIGHALGMTPAHARQYTKATGGGDGDHCSSNAELVRHDDLGQYGNIPADSDSGSVYVPQLLTRTGRRPQCVMYHTRTRVHHRAEFCALCQEWLRSDRLEGRWSFPMT